MQTVPSRQVPNLTNSQGISTHLYVVIAWVRVLNTFAAGVRMSRSSQKTSNHMLAIMTEGMSAACALALYEHENAYSMLAMLRKAQHKLEGHLP